MKKRYIFDLDETLLTGDWTTTDQYFLDTFGENAKPFLDNMGDILAIYEKRFQRYSYADLSEYLKKATKLDIKPKDIAEWDQLVSELNDTMEDHALETLDYLRRSGASLVVLTNWFTESQMSRLKRAGLLPYLDTVYGGDVLTKPHKEAYWMAAASVPPEDCMFIGDNVDNDYIGPKACGMDATLYDKNERHHKTLKKIRNLGELRNK